jgi:spore coat protein A
MPAPVVLNKPPVQTQFDASGCAVIGIQNLLLAPAERADLIIDFSDIPAGSKLIFYNDAPAPYPCGDPSNNNVGDISGPDTTNLMQFIVKPRVGSKDLLNFQQTHAALKLALLPLNLEHLRRERATNTRDLTLNEDFDDYGRLIQREGTNVQIYPGTFARAYMDAPTEVIPHGAIEIWRIFNTTADTHPIHLHLVNFQVLSRRPFDVAAYYGKPNGAVPTFTGPARGPDPNESGWKETLRMNPGEMTEIIAKWDLPQVPFKVPLSTRTGVKGHEYVWHCHILEHEEHDMMRPLIVT